LSAFRGYVLHLVGSEQFDRVRSPGLRANWKITINSLAEVWMESTVLLYSFS
jgi:hypothetical protein